MVKDSLRRTIRFDKKVEGSVYKERIDRYKKRQSINYARTLAKHIEVENAVKQYIANNNIPTIQTNFYILFVKEIISKSIEEVGISLYKWRKRGLEFKHLINLAKIYKTEFKEVDPIEEIPGLIGYWPLIEGRGQIAFDMSGYGHNGTIINALWVKRSKNENCLDFNRENSRMEIKDTSTLYKQRNIKTISLWFCRTGPFNSSYIFSKGFRELAGEADRMFIYTFSAGPIQLWYKMYGKETGDLTYCMTNVEAYRWYHLALVITENKVRLYIDGNCVAERDLIELPGNSDEPIIIGSGKHPFTQEFMRGFAGMIDKIRLYDRPLTDDEIKLIYNREKI